MIDFNWIGFPNGHWRCALSGRDVYGVVGPSSLGDYYIFSFFIAGLLVECGSGHSLGDAKLKVERLLEKEFHSGRAFRAARTREGAAS